MVPCVECYGLFPNWQLSRPVTETTAVKPVQFQRAGGKDPEKSDTVDTAGWGSNNWGVRPNKLMELSIPVMARWICGRSDYYGEDFTQNMICAAKSRKDTCDVSFDFSVEREFHVNFRAVNGHQCSNCVPQT